MVIAQALGKCCWNDKTIAITLLLSVNTITKNWSYGDGRRNKGIFGKDIEYSCHCTAMDDG